VHSWWAQDGMCGNLLLLLLLWSQVGQLEQPMEWWLGGSPHPSHHPPQQPVSLVNNTLQQDLSQLGLGLRLQKPSNSAPCQLACLPPRPACTFPSPGLMMAAGGDCHWYR
jgi:hypothetical protein